MLPLSSSNAKWQSSHPWVSVTSVRAANLHDGGHKVRVRKRRVGSTADRQADRQENLQSWFTPTPQQRLSEKTDEQTASKVLRGGEPRLVRGKEGERSDGWASRNTEQTGHQVNSRVIWTARFFKESSVDWKPTLKHNINLSPPAPPSPQEVKPSWRTVYLTDEGEQVARRLQEHRDQSAASKCSFTDPVNRLLRVTNTWNQMVEMYGPAQPYWHQWSSEWESAYWPSLCIQLSLTTSGKAKKKKSKRVSLRKCSEKMQIYIEAHYVKCNRN